MRRTTLLLVVLSAIVAIAPRAEKRRLTKRRMERKKNDGLGNTRQATEPLHKVDCGGYTCRPGEGNLKGYEHWSMPWTPPSIDEGGPDGGPLLKSAPGWPKKETEFPAALYSNVIAAARGIAKDNFVVFAAADFDFRYLGMNWHRATQRAGITNALLYALDSESYSFFLSMSIPTANGTERMGAWGQTRLQRHIQRALAERHMALAAIANDGLDVLLSDTTHVFQKPVQPFFQSQPPSLDMFAMRGACNAKREPLLGCGLMWNFIYLRGSTADTSRRARLVRFVHTAIEKGMVDFYLRWWAGHHCMFMGYTKLLKDDQPQLEVPARDPTANAANPNSTAVVALRKRSWCEPHALGCLRIGMLPMDRFPGPGDFSAMRATALVGRSPRPDLDPKRSHRLRLDRYDDIDFEDLKTRMVADGLWMLEANEDRPASASSG